jgi:hypothetical protein
MLDTVHLYAVRAVLNTLYIVKEKQAISSSQNFLLVFLTSSNKYQDCI